MTERTRGRRRAAHARHATPRPDNFYGRVVHEGEAALAEAAAADGLADETALLRVLVRRQIEERPENLEQTIKALHLLVRMVAVQFRLSGEDTARLSEQVHQIGEQLAIAVLGAEGNDA
jgi:response regulator RpfG family c-di-GMP phosphodiesterase